MLPNLRLVSSVDLRELNLFILQNEAELASSVHTLLEVELHGLRRLNLEVLFILLLSFKILK